MNKKTLLLISLTALTFIFLGCQKIEAKKAEGLIPPQTDLLFKNGDKVAFLGDSITAGGASYGRYCRLVVHGLKSKGIQVKPILAGIPGNTTKDMLARLDEDVLRHQPDWVILAAGVNDIWHRDPTVKIGVFQPKPGMGVNLEDYQKNVREILHRCRSAGTKLMLTTITPIKEDPEFKLNLQAREYNAFLRTLAEKENLPIASLNEAMFGEIAKGKRLTSDGVHPIIEGHRVMAKGLLEAIGLELEFSCILLL